MQNTSSVASEVQIHAWINAKVNSINYISSIADEVLSHIQPTSASSSSLSPVHHLVILSTNVLIILLADIGQNESTMKISDIASSTWGHSNSLLDHLQGAITFLRKNKNYIGEYLVRRLFTNLVRVNPTSSPEEIRKAIELEQEHLDTLFFFPDQPRSDQEKYDAHLSNCLFLLAKLTELYVNSQTLNEQLPEVLDHLKDCLSMESTLSKATVTLIRRSLAFFDSRPEWFFFQDFFQAKHHLQKAKQEEENKTIQNQIELQLIVLETNQATRFTEGCKEDLLALIKRIDALLGSSRSHALIALLCRARICEFLAKDSNQTETYIKNLLGTLSLAIKTGEEKNHELDFKALQALATCRFLFGFYSSFCFKKEQEYQKGRETLLKAAQDFWTDRETKKAISLLNECFSPMKECPSPIAFEKKNFIKLFYFKWMLLEKIEDLYVKMTIVDEMSPQNQDMEKDEISIWRRCKEQFVFSFFNNKFEQMQEILVNYLRFHIWRAKELVLPYYEERKPFRFMTLTKEFIESIETIYDPSQGIQISLDRASLAHILMQSKENPLIGSELANQEFFLLSEISTNIAIQARAIQVKMTQYDSKQHQNLSVAPLVKAATDSIEIQPISNLQWFANIYWSIKTILQTLQGNLSYRTAISKTMQSFLVNIANSLQINYILGRGESFLKGKEKQQIFELRHHVPTLKSCCDLSVEIYLNLEHYVGWNPPGKAYDVIFQLSLQSLFCQYYVANSNQEKIDLVLKLIHLIKKHQLQVGQRTPPDSIQMENLHVHSLSFSLLLSTLSNDEANQNLRESILSNLGETVEEIESALFPSKNENRSEVVVKDLFSIINFKIFHLFENQKIEAGKALIKSLLGITRFPRENKKNWKPNLTVDFMVNPDFININKLRRGFYQGDHLIPRLADLKMKKSSVESTTSAESVQSEQKRVKEETKEILQKQSDF